jgi:hypothetical protein
LLGLHPPPGPRPSRAGVINAELLPGAAAENDAPPLGGEAIAERYHEYCWNAPSPLAGEGRGGGDDQRTRVMKPRHPLRDSPSWAGMISAELLPGRAASLLFFRPAGC